MRKALGYQIITGPEGIREADTFTCCHCQSVIERKPFVCATDDAIGAWCHSCNAVMCLSCVGKGCLPIEKWLDQHEKRRYIDECL